ncbi:YdeI/OmpD-associated family protein [Roseomonas sp. CCTCC AB2023176]|uniref:YdeI/OmpD-associated family protein n=1 Tax=Roseomonas sp. CCTCC AB2023176 TaxID=3342640 RepID=UPI0035DDB84B
MPAYPHRFEAPVVLHDVGTYRYTVVFLPPDLAATLDFPPGNRLRASGEVADIPFGGAWQPVRGRWFLMLSKDLIRTAEIKPGDVVEVRFRVEPPDTVETPEALDRALEADHKAKAAWNAMTPGARRGLAHRVASAKTPATVARRLDEALAVLRGEAPYRVPGKRREPA